MKKTISSLTLCFVFALGATAFGQNEVSNPAPADGAEAVWPTPAILQWSAPSWAASLDAVSYDIYLGDDPNGLALAGNTVPTAYPVAQGFVPGQTYYWRVDTVLADATLMGELWSFTVRGYQATNPAPADGEIDSSLTPTVSWRTGLTAVRHHIYLGTSMVAVAAATVDSAEYKGTQARADNTFAAGQLDSLTTYYWRIDEDDALGTVTQGDVWRFTTSIIFESIDPNLVGYWKFDEGEGTRVFDWSGNNNHGARALNNDSSLIDAEWVTGNLGSALRFYGNDSRVVIPHSPSLSFASGDVHMSLWIMFERLTGNGGSRFQNFIDKAGSRVVWLATDNNQKRIHLSIGAAGDYTGGHNGGDQISTWEWMHLVAGNVNNKHVYYINGEQSITREDTKPTPTNNTGAITIGRNFQGVIDEFRLYNRGIEPDEVQAIMMGDSRFALTPRPAHVSEASVDTTQLTWVGPEDAKAYNVYFGTSDEGLAAKGQVTDPVFALTEILAPGQSYAWRIDSVLADDSVARGILWTFTAAAETLIDNFEAYGDIEGQEIFNTWVDGYQDNANGSQVGYFYPPFAERAIVNSGRQSMPLHYDNNVAATSETILTFATAQNWSGAASLVLNVRGKADNTGGQLYVKVNGVRVDYAGAVDVISSTEWTAWTIDLAALGIDLTAVNSITIGIDGATTVGLLYIDDIELQ